jgi:CelD/BcsL family acetyltransferase involved in cellulose biosynthesis
MLTTTTLPAGASAAQLSATTPERLAGSDDLRAQWSTMLNGEWNPYVVYQTPEWFDHVVHTGREQLLSPLVLHGQGKNVRGLALPYRKRHSLPFEVRQYPLWRVHLETIAFLGCEPLVPRDHGTYEALLANALDAAPDADGVYLHSVPTDSFLWNCLQQSEWIARHLRIYVPHRVRRFHALRLPASFDEYLATQFRKKKRYNLKRQLRLLEEHAGGRLEWRRVEAPDETGGFAEAARQVVSQSWQSRWLIPDTFESLSHPEWLQDLAHRGLLRSYVLLCAGTPCAMVLGYQARGTFHYSETSYDQSFARFSPGSILLYLLIGDLLSYRAPQWISFGAGDSLYKEEFSNRHWNDAAVLVLRRSARCAFLSGAHACFRGAVDLARQWGSRSPSQESPASV